MSYTPTVFKNGQAPALNATEMNKIGNGIKANADDITQLNTDLTNQANAIGVVNELKVTAVTYTLKGVAFTINGGVVNAVGTATGNIYLPLGNVSMKANIKQYLSGCPSGGASNKYFVYIDGITNYDIGSGAEYTPTSDVVKAIGIAIMSGQEMNHTFYPMVSRAKGEYQPYIGSDSIPKAITNKPTISEVTGNVEIETLKGKAKLFATNGIVPSDGYEVASCGKNLFNFTLDELKALNTKGVWSNNVYTIYGVTLTVNNDMTITINGTPTKAIEFIMGYFTPIVGQSYTFSVGDYKTSGYSRCYIVGVNGTSGWYDVGTFTATTNNRISCILKVEASFSNKVLSAMLRYSFITDDTYERYVGENRATISNSDGVYLDTYDGVTYIIAPNEVTTIYGGNVQGNELLKNDSALNENIAKLQAAVIALGGTIN